MTEAATLAARLAHDVGKYVARAARNLPDGDVPEVLVEMLAADLYALDGSRRASEVFAHRSAELRRLRPDARLDEAEALLSEADRLEPAVRAGEIEAVRRAAECALGVADRLRALARELGP